MYREVQVWTRQKKTMQEQAYQSTQTVSLQHKFAEMEEKYRLATNLMQLQAFVTGLNSCITCACGFCMVMVELTWLEASYILVNMSLIQILHPQAFFVGTHGVSQT